MKNMNRLTLIAFAPLFAITTILGAAEPSLPKGKEWRQEAREAYWLGKQMGLTTEATRRIQEQLIPQEVSIVVKNYTDSALEIIFKEIKTNHKIASAKLAPAIGIGIGRVEDEKTINLPLLPVRATAYFTMKHAGKTLRYSGSFELTAQELKEIEFIGIAGIRAVIKYRNYEPGTQYNRFDDKYFTDMSSAMMPSGSRQ